MSIHVSNQAWSRDLGRGEKFVLLAYADYAAHDGTRVYPSQATIAKKTGFGIRQVQRITRRLQDLGYLIPDGRGPGGVRRWRIVMPPEIVAELGGRADGAAPISPNRHTRPSRDVLHSVGQTPANRAAESPAAPSSPQGPDMLSDDILSHDILSDPTSETDADDSQVGYVRTPESYKPSLTVLEPSTRAELSQEEKDQANAQVTAMIALGRRATYLNRDKIPEPYLAYADIYHELTGQEPTKRVLHDWLQEFSTWQSEGIQAEHVRTAHRQASGKFAVLRPGSLTRTAAALKARNKTAAMEPRDPEALRREVAHLQRSLADGRARAAEGYAALKLPCEEPAAMQPSLAQVPVLYGMEPAPARVPPPDWFIDRMSKLGRSPFRPRWAK